MSPIPPPRSRQPSGDTPPVPPAGESSAPNGSRTRGALSARARSGGSVREKQRASRAVLIAVGIHLLVGVVLVQVLTFGHGIPSWLRFGSGEPPIEERLTYVAPREQPKPVAQVKKPTPQTTTTTRPAVTMPVTSGPEVVSAPSAPRDTGSGAAVGQGDGSGIGAGDPNVRGVRPGYFDGRVWRDPVVVGNAGGGGGGDRADNLDSIMGFILTQAADSLDSLNRAQGRTGRKPGDWTKTGKNGEKWGWDSQGIRLGKVMIPNALLALLPLNAGTAGRMSGNMSQMESERRLATSRTDIMRMSERGMGEADFRKIVNELRDRREKERRDRLKAPSATVAAPVKSGGDR
ncbi:hypothetical protein [Gemmatimonas groenlandica]|uniref:Uncharacterized protein n=1 Tax=Gemmatimonas groenlandica TaxID=2732249 RepID=A0A6M4IK79_9BACT|nr:hypothetical protein [Gemmatimonas groenlandica]QJR35464.1 hypothetical protein HKW67_08065 [Gemmatimonas groenlandica]